MDRSLNDLHPQFRPLVDLWLSDMRQVSINQIITCTLRSGVEQDALYAQGRTLPGEIVTWAKSGESAHNFGLAIDFVVLNHTKPDWSGKGELWDRAIALAKARGLESLRPKESCHLQHHAWREIAGL